jgi:hypothetical protein
VFIGASVGIIHMFRGRRVGLGQVAGALMILGSAVGFGWYAFGVAEYEMVNHSGLDRAALATFLDKAEDSTATILPFIVLFLLGMVVALILLGIAAWRRRLVPVWSAVLMALRSRRSSC